MEYQSSHTGKQIDRSVFNSNHNERYVVHKAFPTETAEIGVKYYYEYSPRVTGNEPVYEYGNIEYSNDGNCNLLFHNKDIDNWDMFIKPCIIYKDINGINRLISIADISSINVNTYSINFIIRKGKVIYNPVDDCPNILSANTLYNMHYNVYAVTNTYRKNGKRRGVLKKTRLDKAFEHEFQDVYVRVCKKHIYNRKIKYYKKLVHYTLSHNKLYYIKA